MVKYDGIVVSTQFFLDTTLRLQYLDIARIFQPYYIAPQEFVRL